MKRRKKPPKACKRCGAPVPKGWNNYCSAPCMLVGAK